MSDQNPEDTTPLTDDTVPLAGASAPAPAGYEAAPPPPPAYAPAPAGPAYAGTPYVGTVRSTGLTIFLFIITFGIWGWVWWFLVHDEMKKHSGQGVGGLLALIIAFFISPVMAFITSDEVGKLYERRGQQAPVNALTGLWYFPGMLLIFLPIVWFVKTNGALNDYWRSLGAQ